MELTITDRVEAQLRHEIATGILPPSEKLRVEHLKLRYDAGTSPIREALSRLSSEGLVDLEANKGFRVAGLSREDLYDIAVTRAGVEQAAVMRSIELGGDDWESHIVAQLHRFRLASRRYLENRCEETLCRWESVHDDLHRAIVAACDAPRLLAFQERLLVQHGRYRRLCIPYSQIRRNSSADANAFVREHENLVDTVLSRDVEKARQAIEAHMMLTYDMLESAGWPGWPNK